MYTLCSECNNANGGNFKEGQCYICEGKMQNAKEMAQEAVKLLSKGDYKGFSISTSVPKDWQIREEALWDEKAEGTESIKNYLNRSLSSSLETKTGITYTAEGDCRIIFDMRSGKISLELNDLHIFGRYEKLVAGISQSRWTCKTCKGKGCRKCGGKGKNYESIEEKIGDPAKSECKASSYSLHASGREDVDALNSAGRPFVLSIKNPKNRNPDLDKISKEIADGKEIIARDLKLVPKRFIEVVTESHFDKGYIAESVFERELTNEDLKKILSISGIMLAQKTPTRVMRRRADLVRKRRVLSLKIVEHSGNRAILEIMAEAGTYIKELISGDGGRTEPSIASVLGMSAKCERLIVSEIDDKFLDLCKN